LKDAKVWKTLFYNDQLEGQALLRNITRLARIGAFDDMVFAADYAERIVDEERIAKTRLHPINFLNAAIVFQLGQIDRRVEDYWGGYSTYDRLKDWKTNGKVLDALNEGFYLAHKYVKPSDKRHLIAVDVSGSMAGSAGGKGSVDLSAAQVAGAQAMTIARTEKYSDIVGFSRKLVDLGITAKTSLSEAMSRVQMSSFGSTNPSAAIEYAIANKIDVDVFTIITDNEVNHGKKPFQSIRDYRQKSGIDAKMIVVGVTATDFTIADPSDKGMLDVVGFDSNAPKLISDFSAGRL
jgi:60 kDa SS-A/Ro ribonucleoprotein